MDPTQPTPARQDEASSAAFVLADALPHPVWVLEGGQVFFNRSFTEFTGLFTPSPDRLDEALTQALHPDDCEPWEAAWTQARSERKAQALELRLRRRDGAYLWFIAHLRPLAQTGWVVSYTEVDGLRQARAETVAMREHMGEAYFALDRNWRFTYLNREAERLLGQPREQLLGKGIWEEYAGALGTEFHRQYTRALEEGIPVAFEAYYPPLGAWFEVHAHPEDEGLAVYFQAINDRKRAEATELKYQQLFETVPLGVVYQDREGRILSANPAAQRILGLTLEQMQGTTSLDPRWRAIKADGSPFPGEEHPAMVALRTGQPVRDVLMGVFHPAREEYRWILVDATPLFEDETGRPSQVYTVFRDISERRRAEQALQESENRLRLILESIGEGVYGIDVEGRCTFINPAAAQQLGYIPEEVLGQNMHALIHHHRPDGSPYPLEECRIARALRERRGCWVEDEVFWRKDGTALAVEYRAHPILEGGQLRGAVISFSDITARKQAEQATAYLAAVVESSADAILSKNLDGVITSWNRGAEEMYGYSAEEVVGQPMTLLIPPHLVGEEEKILERVRRGKRIEQYETLRRRKDGSDLYVSLTVSPIRDRGGRVIGASSIARDITQRKLEEEGLRFLDQASVALAANLDVEETLRQIAQLAVPRLADWCSVSLPNAEGKLEALEIAHTNPERVQLVRELAVEYPEDPEAPGSGAQLMRTGQYTLVPEVTDEMLQAAARDQRHLELLRRLELGSALVVPMLAGGEAVGLIGLGMSRGSRRFGARDLALAQELGRRAGVALAHARLYRQLQEREQELRTLADSLPQLSWMADETGSIFWYNQRWYDYTGTTHAEMEGWGWQKVHDPEVLPKVMERWLESLRTGQPFEMVFPLRGRDGRFRQFLTRGVPLRNNKGQVIRWFGTSTDITQQIETEEALRESQERYRSLIENYPGGAVILFDQELRYLLVDGLGLADVGLSREAMEERTVYELFEPGLAERLAGLYRRALAGERMSDEVHFGGRTYLVWVAPVRSPDGRVRQGLAFTQDITELKRLERELRDLNAELEARVAQRTAELERSNRDLEQFAYVASHDLQEPLRMISSYTQLLAKRYADKLDEKAHQYIHYAVDGANRMQRLIQDLLAYSRVGTRAQALEPTDAHAVLRETLENLQFAIQESGTVVEADPLPMVLADRSQLGQVFQNLIANAIKFRHPERPLHIRIAAVRQEGMWRFSVQDNGIGIEEQYFERIFVIFQRLHGKEDYPGSGIGLAMCKKIVERHGGKIWLESVPGEGACFYFTWPAVDSDQTDEKSRVNREQR